MMKKSRLILVSVVFVLCFVLSGIALAADQKVEICFALDGSFSIAANCDPGDISSCIFYIQTRDLAAAISDSTVIPRNGTVAVSVVEFSESASVVVQRTVIDSEATAAAVAGQVSLITPSVGIESAIGDSIAACAGTFKYDKGWKQVIDVSTDGMTGTDPGAAADAAVAAGVDAINAIAIGNSDWGLDILKSMVRPQPAKSIGEGDGFVVSVATMDDYAAALKEKIKFEVSRLEVEVPTMTEWGMIIFMILAGAGAFYYLRRMKMA
jgi:hypothetical protein